MSPYGAPDDQFVGIAGTRERLRHRAEAITLVSLTEHETLAIPSPSPLLHPGSHVKPPMGDKKGTQEKEKKERKKQTRRVQTDVIFPSGRTEMPYLVIHGGL